MKTPKKGTIRRALPRRLDSLIRDWLDCLRRYARSSEHAVCPVEQNNYTFSLFAASDRRLDDLAALKVGHHGKKRGTIGAHRASNAKRCACALRA
jgi:hypothetical protein